MALLPQNPNQDSNEQLILFSLLSNVLSRYSKEGRNILDKDISILVPFLIQVIFFPQKNNLSTFDVK